MQKNRIKNFLKKYIIPATPLSIKCMRAILLDKDIKKFLKKIRIDGDVLDVGSQKAQYKRYVRCRNYLTLDIDESHNPDICCDAHNIKSKSNQFQMVIITEVLEHCYEPQKVINEIYRVLKPGGICLASVPFMFEYHTAPGVKDYYRFTKDGLGYHFRKFSDVRIKAQGNRLHVIWENINSGGIISKFFLNVFNPLIAVMGSTKNSPCPLGYILVARKPEKRKRD